MLHIVQALKRYGGYVQDDGAGPGFELDGSFNESYATWAKSGISSSTLPFKASNLRKEDLGSAQVSTGTCGS
jgi:hypothetical protein